MDPLTRRDVLRKGAMVPAVMTCLASGALASGETPTAKRLEEVAGYQIAEEVARHPCYKSDQRRLVDITPGEMLTASHVIEFVTEEAVVESRAQQDQQFRRGQGEDHPCGQPRT